MNLIKVEINYKQCEMNHNKNYGKSITDKTHFKPNVSVWNDLQGANNTVGQYDDNMEIGKIRAMLSNPSLDMAERDTIVKSLYKKYKDEGNKELTELLDKMNVPNEEKQDTETIDNTNNNNENS